MIKKLTSILLVFALTFTSALTVVYGEENGAASNAWKEFYVSESGSDSNDGSREHPFMTIKKAKETAASISDSMSGDIVINIAGGTYRIDETLDFTNADSGKNGHSIIYRGDKDNKPVISGGRTVDNFRQSADYPGLYEAYLPDYEKYGIRELYVNDSKRFVAISERYITPAGNYQEEGSKNSSDGIIVSKDDIPKFDDPEDVTQAEFVWLNEWKKTMCCPISIEENPKDKSTMIVKFGTVVNNEFAGPGIKFQIQNCMGVLDTPGEFYYNKRTGMLYYMPYADEKPDNLQLVVPNLEFCMFFIGNGVSYPVENISFENLKIEHFTRWFNDTYYATGQADVGPAYNGSSLRGNTRGAVYIDKASNVNFINNIFCNMGDCAINIFSSTSNCRIEGNVFYDLGGAAIRLGTSLNNETTALADFKLDMTPEKNPKTDFMLMHMNPYITAYGTDGIQYLHTSRSSLECFCIGFQKTSVPDLYSYKRRPANNGTWRSGEVKEGEKAFVMYDFARKYSFSEIALCFNPDGVKVIDGGYYEGVTAQEKSNYEILLSNDEDFAEGNYVTVAVQNGPADEIARYKVDTDEKYRYLMVRKLDDSPFALSFLYPFTKDYPHDILMKRCENIDISNNYIKRVSDEWMGDPAITAKTCNNLTISNNEICDVPYTGINWGWGWQSHLKNGWATIKNNYLHNTNAVGYDGGCLYIFGGCHVGDNRTVVENNWLRSYRGKGIYNDNGCMGVDMTDNVIELVTSPMWMSEGAQGNTIGRTYSTIPTILTSSSKFELMKAVYTDIGELTTYTPGDDTTETYRIKSEAGLTDEYAHIKDYVPDGIPSYDLWGSYDMNDGIAVSLVKFDHIALIETLKYILENGVFGDGYGMYPSNIKFEIENAISKYGTFTNGEKVLELRAFVEYVEKSFNRVEYAQMLKVCEDKLSGTECVSSLRDIDSGSAYNTVLKSAKDKFETELTGIKADADGADKYKLFELNKKLEAAYNEFCENIITPRVTTAYSENLVSADIDEENKKIVLQLPEYAAETDKFSFGATQNGLLTNSVDRLVYDQKVQLPLYSKITKKYDIWSVETQKTGKTYGRITADGFASHSEKIGVSKYALADGGIAYENLQGEFCWYSNTDVYNDAENEFRFSVKNERENNSVTFLLRAENLSDFYRNSNIKRHDRVELAFKNSMMYVYTVKNGVKTLNYSGISDIDYKNVNDVKYKITPRGGYSALDLTVNGKSYNIPCSDEVSGTAFGFYSDSLPIVLY